MGQLHSKSYLCLGDLRPLVAPDAAQAWVHMAMPGEWHGYVEDDGELGEFSFDAEVFQSLVDRFNAQANPVQIDYEHGSLIHDATPKPAAGWIHQLEIREGGLWGLCEFTKRAAQMIRDGEYRFSSPVVVWGGNDRKTGEPYMAELHSLALTNSPFLDGQEPIKLGWTRSFDKSGKNVIMLTRTGEHMSKRVSKLMDTKGLLAKIQMALGELPKNPKAEQAMKALWAAYDLQVAVEGEEMAPEPAAPEEPAAEEMSAVPGEIAMKRRAMADAPPAPEAGAEKAPEEAPAESSNPAAEVMALLSQILGLPEGAEPGKILDALRAKAEDMAKLCAEKAAMSVGAQEAGEAEYKGLPGNSNEVPDLSLKVAEGTIAALKSRLAELEGKTLAAEDDEHVREVEALIKSGRALPEERDTLLALSRKDKAAFVRLTSARPQLVPTKKVVKPESNDTESNVVLSATDKQRLRQFQLAGIDEKTALKLVKG